MGEPDKKEMAAPRAAEAFGTREVLHEPTRKQLAGLKIRPPAFII
ncbi:Uncharacterised protein [uncultured archaeon]|nr:Uncharacterised protein [uncultured archaeon]